MRSQGKTLRALVASRLNRFLGVDPPDRAMVKRPRAMTASLAAWTISSAPAANNSCGVVSGRISTVELKGPAQVFRASAAKTQRLKPLAIWATHGAAESRALSNHCPFKSSLFQITLFQLTAVSKPSRSFKSRALSNCNQLAAADGGTSRRSQQSGLLVGDHMHRHCFQQRPQASLVHKRLHEQRPGQFAENLW